MQGSFGSRENKNKPKQDKGGYGKCHPNSSDRRQAEMPQPQPKKIKRQVQTVRFGRVHRRRIRYRLYGACSDASDYRTCDDVFRQLYQRKIRRCDGLRCNVLYQASARIRSCGRCAHVCYFKNQSRAYKKATPVIAAISLILLILVLIHPYRLDGKEEFRRWLKLGIVFQPSDVAKLGIIMTFAWLLEKYRHQIETNGGSLLSFSDCSDFFVCLSTLKSTFHVQFL